MIKKLLSVVLTFTMLFCLSACGNKAFEEKGDYLTGNKWRGTDGTLIALDTDGTYKYYNNSEDLNNNYFKGTFVVRSGQDAIDYLVSTQGLDEESQRKAMDKYMVKDEHYYVLTLNAEERIVNGKNDLAEKTVTEFFGYYSEKDQHLNFTSFKTLKSMDYYKK